jgi:hypothetical protein
MSSIYSNFTPTFLYIKQHKVTGKLYFGKTIRNPEKYKGSGVHWKAHIKKHGKDTETLWYCLYNDEESIKDAALQFSKLWNIVDSQEWLNLIEEDGVDCHVQAGKLGAETIKNKLWINNGSHEYMIDKNFTIPTDYNVGRLVSKAFAGGKGRHCAKNSKWWNNGKISIMSTEKPNETFVLGRLFNSNGKTKKIKTQENYKNNLKYCCICNIVLPYDKRKHKTCGNICHKANQKEKRRLFWFNKK